MKRANKSSLQLMLLTGMLTSTNILANNNDYLSDITTNKLNVISTEQTLGYNCRPNSFQIPTEQVNSNSDIQYTANHCLRPPTRPPQP